MKRKQKFESLKHTIKKLKTSSDTFDADAAINSFFKALKPGSPSVDKLLTSFGEEDFYSISEFQNINCQFSKAVLTAMPRFKKLVKNKSLASGIKGCPLVVIITISAVRATDIVSSISKQFHCKIAKLFAKHIKIQQQIDYLLSQEYPIAIGTPNRLNKLIELGALSLSKSRIVLIDTYTDKKDFSVMTLPLVCDDFQLFMQKYVLPDMKHIKLCCV